MALNRIYSSLHVAFINYFHFNPSDGNNDAFLIDFLLHTDLGMQRATTDIVQMILLDRPKWRLFGRRNLIRPHIKILFEQSQYSFFNIFGSDLSLWFTELFKGKMSSDFKKMVPAAILAHMQDNGKGSMLFRVLGIDTLNFLIWNPPPRASLVRIWNRN